MARREAVAPVPWTLAWAPELGAKPLHTRLNLGGKSNCGEREGEKGETKQRRFDHFLVANWRKGSPRTGGLPRGLPGYGLPCPGRGAHGLIAAGLVCKDCPRCL